MSENKTHILYFLFIVFACNSCNTKSSKFESPDKNISLFFGVNTKGTPWYIVNQNSKKIIDTSYLGLEFKKGNSFIENLSIENTESKEFNTSWSPVWGQHNAIQNKYTNVKISLTNKTGDAIEVLFRIYNEGVAFRYIVPKQEQNKEFIVQDEKTEFNLTGDHETWWLPANYNSYEHPTTHSKISEIQVTEEQLNYFLVKGIENKKAVHTPLTMRTNEGNYISIHEASLVNYSSMTLELNDKKKGFTCDLVPAANGTKAILPSSFQTPWRTIQISDTPGGLLESSLILNLNEPNKIKNTDWIQPTKYMGIWWGIHIGKYTFEPGSNHGATTENAIEYIDFASKHGIKGLLIEGWNKGIEYFVGKSKDLPNFQTPTEDYDLKEVAAYAKEKGIELVGYHETGAHVLNYEKHMEAAMAYLKSNGINYLKVGFVSNIIPKGEHHHGQWMVNFYQKMVETAAKHKIMLIVHEPIKPTGLARTWPNMMTREGVRGQEFNAWSEGNPPEHTVTLPFTRILAGPIDYTPGIFNLKFDEYRKDNAVRTTLAHQLALYVVLYSPIQMAADLPEHYQEHLDAFQFIKDVPVDWDDTKVLNAEISEYVTIARKDKNSEDWFIGSITNEEERELEISLRFLDDTLKYEAIIYQDGIGADYLTNPTVYEIKRIRVNSKSHIKIQLAKGGGATIHIKNNK
ncbi:glycoside hydrolase family 97 protein [Algibacter agarivorans]|uniref:Glycoside hydrolase family 97 protein n=1 Tax=Algibacter agarivorans TaxID=1109741 RepID=A0ABP9GWE6_9FLAO